MDFPTFAEVRQRVGGVKGVIRMLGDAPQFEHKWKSFPACPFCGHKDSAGVFEKGGVEWFKCQFDGCSTGGRVVAETGYINLREGLSEDSPPEGGPSPAYKRLLELARMYVEPKAKAEMGKAESRNEEAPAEPVLPNPVLPADTRTPAPTPPASTNDVALIQAAVELIRKEKKASVRLLMSGLRLGYARALLVMEGLERWGVVGPAVPGEKFRAILNLPEAGGPPPAQSVGSIDQPGGGNPAAATVPTSPSGPAFINDGGFPGPSENGGHVPPELPQQKSAPTPPEMAAPGPAGSSESPVEKGPLPKVEEEKPGVIAPGLTVLRWFYLKLPPTSVEMRPYMPDGSPVPSPLPTSQLKKIKFRPVSLARRRMLPPAACAALGLCANPRENEKWLLEARGEFEWDELEASGLWVEADHRRGLHRRPNSQFYGFGQVGKKPERERKDKDDKFQWGWSEPTLIPYFNEGGELIKLRPHKGGATGGTAAGSEHIYVPRDYRSCADKVEKFRVVIVCEGEYKAAVIWWYVGGGAALHGDGRPPYGACALPGISFAKSPAYRAELEDWLRAVECQRVIVAFDDEDKSHKPVRQAYDSQIYGRYLAISLFQELKIPALWLPLPKTWRVNGKADWDGGLVKLRDDARAAK